MTLAAGGSFCKYSHEFQTVTAFGEDQIFFCPKCKLAINKEIIEEEGYQCFKCKNKKLEEKKAIETGNIFKLKDKFSQAFNFNFKDKDGKEKKVLMGCYGIGISRLMGTIVEVHHDERGIIWPKEVAPFQVHLIPIENVKLSSKFLRQGRTNSKNLPRFARQNLEGFAYSNEVKKTIEKLYQDFQKEGIEVLYDDRLDKTVGEKFADADLMGIPHRLVVSERTLVKNSVEIKKRDKKEGELVKISQAIKAVRAYDFVK